jgi:hypothetical protein
MHIFGKSGSPIIEDTSFFVIPILSSEKFDMILFFLLSAIVYGNFLVSETNAC